jgi:hypothetical protein
MLVQAICVSDCNLKKQRLRRKEVLCFSFWSSKSSSNDNHFSRRNNTCHLFSYLLAGGTYWNEARETYNTDGDLVNVLSVDPRERIVGIQNTDAVSGIIDLSGQIVNFE